MREWDRQQAHALKATIAERDQLARDLEAEKARSDAMANQWSADTLMYARDLDASRAELADYKERHANQVKANEEDWNVFRSIGRALGFDSFRLVDLVPAIHAAIQRADSAERRVADMLKVAKGCHDYSGGYRDAEREVFQHGISTVVNALKAYLENPNDTQVRALIACAAPPIPADLSRDGGVWPEDFVAAKKEGE